MRTRIVILLAAALFVACGKKKEEKPTPPPGPEPVVVPGGKPLASCDALIPKALRTQYFSGLTLVPTAPQQTGAGTMLTCIFGKPGPEQQIVQVNCSSIVPNTLDADMREIRSRMTDVKDVAGIGRMAFTGTEGGRKILHFVDDDTRCYGQVVSSPDAEGIAKALLAELTPESIK